MHLSIKLLGGFQVLLDDRPAVFATDRARGLLAYLAVEADRLHRRAALADLVWPNRPDSLALKNFSQTLSRVRRAIGDRFANPAFLLITTKTIQFNSYTSDLDVAYFETLLRESKVHPHLSLSSCPVCLAKLERAAGLYRGEFLQGLSLADSQPFEEWALFKREQYHRQVLNALSTLATHALKRSEYEQAQSFAERQLSLEPWREEAYHQLIEELALSGQRSLALRQYKNYCRVLAYELGMEPAPVITELYERVRYGHPSPAEPPDLAESPLS